jgi:magnesium transporter
MNFEPMPELDWASGYPMSIGLGIASAMHPYSWFRKKEWMGRVTDSTRMDLQERSS